VSYLKRGCSHFKGNELGFWIFKKLLPHIWQGLLICPFPTTFTTICEVPGYQWAGCRMAPLQVYGYVLEGWPYPWFHQFSRCACIYCIFWTFEYLNSNMNFGYIKYTLEFLEENTCRCPGSVETLKPCLTGVHHPPCHTQCPPPAWPRFQVGPRERVTSYYYVNIFFYKVK
jgi:hypothetical protein